MSNTLPSRNPFADPNGLTLADLIVRVRSADTLSLPTRQNWAWALKTVARAAGKDPGTVPAHPQFLRKVLGGAAPGVIGIGHASWNNARSLCSKVLAWAELVSVPGHYLAPFGPAWTELWSKLPADTALPHQLGRLFHFASAQGIAPGEISDEVLTIFYEGLITESIVPDPYEIWRGAAKSWNHAAERISWLAAHASKCAVAQTKFLNALGRLPAYTRGRCRGLSSPCGWARPRRRDVLAGSTTRHP